MILSLIRSEEQTTRGLHVPCEQPCRTVLLVLDATCLRHSAGLHPFRFASSSASKQSSTVMSLIRR
jgi:hypothetical protein